MKRTRTNKSAKPIAILSADWHLRHDRPTSRKDEYLLEQEECVKYIISLANKYDCPIIIAGDLGHRHQWPCWLLWWFISMILTRYKPAPMPLLIPGQHDIPFHRIDDIWKSGIAVLELAKVLQITSMSVITMFDNLDVLSFPWGTPIDHLKGNRLNPVMAVSHQMVIHNKPLWPGQDAPKANSLLREFPEYDLILTGDNHQTFVEEYQGRYLVNPGSMMRMTIDQKDHRPCVFLWYGPGNAPEPVYLPAAEDVWNETGKIETDRKKRTSKYVEALMDNYKVGPSFLDNLQSLYRKKRVAQPVKDKIAAHIPQKG